MLCDLCLIFTNFKRPVTFFCLKYAYFNSDPNIFLLNILTIKIYQTTVEHC